MGLGLGHKAGVQIRSFALEKGIALAYALLEKNGQEHLLGSPCDLYLLTTYYVSGSAQVLDNPPLNKAQLPAFMKHICT